jgi:hypothetical protein
MTRRKECTITVAWDEPIATIAITRRILETRIETTFAPDRRATVIVGHISDITPTPPSVADQAEQILRGIGTLESRVSLVRRLIEDLEQRCK